MAEPSLSLVDQLRRMTAEPGNEVYTDTALKAYISAYPLPDSAGLQPDATGWVGTWDLNRAAAAIWEEKAAAVASDFDFAADGGNYTRSQVHQQYLRNASRYRAQRSAAVVPAKAASSTSDVTAWIGNLPEA